jgi:hypothetical protein
MLEYKIKKILNMKNNLWPTDIFATRKDYLLDELYKLADDLVEVFEMREGNIDEIVSLSIQIKPERP